MKKIIGKQWKELTNEQREELLSVAEAIDGTTGGKMMEGWCIVDFVGTEYSIPGFVEDGEIRISENAIIYSSVA